MSMHRYAPYSFNPNIITGGSTQAKLTIFYKPFGETIVSEVQQSMLTSFDMFFKKMMGGRERGFPTACNITQNGLGGQTQVQCSQKHYMGIEASYNNIVEGLHRPSIRKIMRHLKQSKSTLENIATNVFDGGTVVGAYW
jgi:hypothetical protein